MLLLKASSVLILVAFSTTPTTTEAFVTSSSSSAPAPAAFKPLAGSELAIASVSPPHPRSHQYYLDYLHAIHVARSKTALYGVLSEASILAAAAASSSNKGKLKHSKAQPRQSSTTVHYHKGPKFYLLLIQEAISRQERIIDALDQQLSKDAASTTSTVLEDKPSQQGDEELNDQNEAAAIKANNNNDKQTRRNNSDSINIRRNQVLSIIQRLQTMNGDVQRSMKAKKEYIPQDSFLSPLNSEDSNSSTLELELISMGFSKLLEKPDEWISNHKTKNREYGRPQGFDGLHFFSPLGVPILVSKQSHKDTILRQAAQGSDLWFQVADYNGSRVLLRSSLVRSAKNSRSCKQMAADLAAHYSDSRYHLDGDEEGVSIMYTDSRHVAKRGSKVGQMRTRKALGKMMGYPLNVQSVVKGREL